MSQIPRSSSGTRSRGPVHVTRHGDYRGMLVGHLSLCLFTAVMQQWRYRGARALLVPWILCLPDPLPPSPVLPSLVLGANIIRTIVPLMTSPAPGVEPVAPSPFTLPQFFLTRLASSFLGMIGGQSNNEAHTDALIDRTPSSTQMGANQRAYMFVGMRNLSLGREVPRVLHRYG